MGTLTFVRNRVEGTPVRRGGWVQYAYVAADVCFVIMGALLVFSFRFGTGWWHSLVEGRAPQIPLWDSYLGFLIAYVALIVLFCESKGLYRVRHDHSDLGETLAVSEVVLIANLVLIASIFISKQDLSRLVVGLNGVLNVTALAGWRLWKRSLTEHRVAKGIGVRNVLIVGANEIGRELAHYLETKKHLGYAVMGFIDSPQSGGSHILGSIEDLPRLVRTRFIDEVFVAGSLPREPLKAVLSEARQQRLAVSLVPDLYEGLRAPIEYWGGLPVMALHWEPFATVGLFVKRMMDVVFSSLGLIALSPLLLVIAATIRRDSTGPVLYCSPRIGKKGRRFTCFKFRTMVANADELKESLRRFNERQGPFFKMANDPRLTKVGKVLRKYSLDELPQLWNVLKGDMSLVGPRPHPVDDYSHYALEHFRRLDVTPGMTGLWQVSARGNPSFEKNMALDLEYINDWDLWLDTKILLKTLPAVLTGTGE